MKRKFLSFVFVISVLVGMSRTLPITVSAKTEGIYTYTVSGYYTYSATITGCDT